MPQNASTSDDQRVLDELERLRRAIRATRKHAPAPVVARAAEPPVGVATHTVNGTRVAASPLHEHPGSAVAPPAPRPDAEPATSPPPQQSNLLPAPAAATRPGRTTLVVASLAVAIALLLGWFLLRDPVPPLPVESAAVSPGAAAPAAAVEPPSAPVDPHPLRIDLVTSRPVWMRVTVDGRIAIERMLPQGERLPFGADKSIVVRAGDAGAVSVWMGTVDRGPLGRDGQVVTRLFEAPVR